MSRVSSIESVVCVRYATRSGSGTVTFSASSRRLDEADRVRRLAERADRLVVVVVADEDDRVALLGVVDGLEVHLGDERAGRVDRLEAASAAAIARTCGRDAVRREDERGVVRDLVDFLDEAGALVAQLVDDVAVVDDLLADVDRAVETSRAFSTTSIARTTPAQKPRRPATRSFSTRIPEKSPGTVTSSPSRRIFPSCCAARAAPAAAAAERARSG